MTTPKTPIRIVPARKPGLDKSGLLAWQVDDGQIVWLPRGERPKVVR